MDRSAIQPTITASDVKPRGASDPPSTLPLLPIFPAATTHGVCGASAGNKLGQRRQLSRAGRPHCQVPGGRRSPRHRRCDGRPRSISSPSSRMRCTKPMSCGRVGASPWPWSRRGSPPPPSPPSPGARRATGFKPRLVVQPASLIRVEVDQGASVGPTVGRHQPNRMRLATHRLRFGVAGLDGLVQLLDRLFLELGLK